MTISRQWVWGSVSEYLPGGLEAFIRLCNTRFRHLGEKLESGALCCDAGDPPGFIPGTPPTGTGSLPTAGSLGITDTFTDNTGVTLDHHEPDSTPGLTYDVGGRHYKISGNRMLAAPNAAGDADWRAWAQRPAYAFDGSELSFDIYARTAIHGIMFGGDPADHRDFWFLSMVQVSGPTVRILLNRVVDDVAVDAYNGTSFSFGTDKRIGMTVTNSTTVDFWYEPAGGGSRTITDTALTLSTGFNYGLGDWGFRTTIAGFAGGTAALEVDNLSGFGVTTGSVGTLARWATSTILTGSIVAQSGTAIAVTGSVATAKVTDTYSASITPDASAGNYHIITATNGTAFTINAPTVTPATGFTERLTFKIKNTSGGALGALTWNGVFKLGAAWTQPATAFSRSIDYDWDGTNWVEANRSAADVAN